MIATTNKHIAREDATKLLGSFILFTQVFYRIRTGKDFLLSQPSGMESHFVTIAKALTKVLRGEITRLIINIPPRYGKTELVINFIAWALARYPDSNFIYTSYSHSLAEKQTATVRDIISHPDYKALFGVELRDDTTAKSEFSTTDGGTVYAVGAQGTITGRGAGIARCERFGGAIIIDDIIKPEDALSDTVREKSNDWFFNTLLSRRNNDDKTPIIYIGQRLHEADLAAKLINKADGYEWDKIILPALCANDVPLYPEKHTKDFLFNLRDTAPYMFASQMQQNPQPAGGGVFKESWFLKLKETPKIIGTFITVDTAETDKDYNDATVFSFFGVYRLTNDIANNQSYALHFIDCKEIRVLPAQLKTEFAAFFTDCKRYEVPPERAYIEKKSTGTTLYSVMKEYQGITVLPIERNSTSGNKAARFLRASELIASKLLTFTDGAKHVDMCIEHLKKITINMTHAHDDIADTVADAVYIALINKSLPFQTPIKEKPKSTIGWGKVI